MSLLIVENVTHGFGGRRILEDASFRLLKGEHVGLIGANGEGKSTFLNIITGQLQPDEGKVEWSRHVTVGYLDQHSTLKPGMKEYQAQANYEHVLYYQGTEGPSFPTIAGSGKNGCMLHYETNRDELIRCRAYPYRCRTTIWPPACFI